MLDCFINCPALSFLFFYPNVLPLIRTSALERKVDDLTKWEGKHPVLNTGTGSTQVPKPGWCKAKWKCSNADAEKAFLLQRSTSTKSKYLRVGRAGISFERNSFWKIDSRLMSVTKSLKPISVLLNVYAIYLILLHFVPNPQKYI